MALKEEPVQDSYCEGESFNSKPYTFPKFSQPIPKDKNQKWNGSPQLSLRNPPLPIFAIVPRTFPVS